MRSTRAPVSRSGTSAAASTQASSPTESGSTSWATHASMPCSPGSAGRVARAMSPSADVPDPAAEREVALRSYWNQLVERWWLPAAGLVIGIVIALLVSFGGNQVYTAKTTVSLAQPLSPTGAVQLQSDATNPSTVGQIIHSEEALREAALKAGVPVGRVRGHVTSRP